MSAIKAGPRPIGSSIEWGWTAIGVSAVAALTFATAWASPAAAEDRSAIAQRETSALCSREAEQAFPEVLAAVRGEGPLYRAPHRGKAVGTPLLVGARLELEARPGLTAQWIERVLRCHQARRVLEGDRAAGADDPFALPGAWLEIGVEPGHALFTAEVRGRTAAEGEQIHARAQALAARPLP